MNILNRLKCAAVLGLTLLSPMFATDAAATAASFTTTNAAVDGPGHCYNGGTGGDPVNCNIYDAKSHVWMNGGPIGEALGPGMYYFVVFQPSGQSNPKDGSDNLLSYDTGGDPYTNRSFTINNDLTITYSGNHNQTGENIRLGLNPDGVGPNLDDWYETTPNSGGEYHLGICRLNADGTQPAKDSCKFDAFKLVQVTTPVCDANHPELCVCDDAHPELCVCDEAHPELCPTCPCGGTFPDCKACAVGPLLTISKDAAGTYDRAITWGITKSVNGPTLRYLASGSTQVDYQVVVTKSTTVNNVKVTGSINVHNGGNQAAIGATVADHLGADFGNLPCTITDPTQFALIAVSSDASSTYGCTLPDGLPAANPGSNNATVNYTGLAADGVTPLAKSDSTVISFDFTENLVGSDCATMSDLFNGVTTVNIGTGSTCDAGTFTYSKTINAGSGCVKYPNVATLTPDGGTAIPSDASVEVCSPVQSGALSKGFWHNKNGQAKIKSAPAPGGVCSVYTFLAGYAPFYGVKTSGDKSCAAVASWVLGVLDQATSAGAAMNPMLRAQMLAAALDYNLLGANFNFNMKYPNDKSAAFGGASCMMIPDMLTFASTAPQYIPPTPEQWYSQMKGIQALAKDAFESIAITTAYECP